jgi:hypothetical protein
MSRPTRCDDVLRRIDDHVDGLLPAEEAESVRDHLDTCRDCRETAFAAKAASTSLAVWGDLDPPAACFDQILHRIQTLPPHALRRPARSTSGRRAWARIVRISLPVAAAAVMVAAIATEAPGRERATVRFAPPPFGGSLAMPASMQAQLPVRVRPRRAAADVYHVEEIDDGVWRTGGEPHAPGVEMWIPR